MKPPIGLLLNTSPPIGLLYSVSRSLEGVRICYLETITLTPIHTNMP